MFWWVVRALLVQQETASSSYTHSRAASSCCCVVSLSCRLALNFSDSLIANWEVLCSSCCSRACEQRQETHSQGLYCTSI